MHGVGDQHAAGSREALETRGDIHTVAEHVIALDDDIAQVHANSKDQVGRRRRAFVPCRDAFLNADRALDRVDRAREFRQNAVAGGLENPPAMRLDRRIENAISNGMQRGKRADFVRLHQPGKADDIGGHYRSEPAANAIAVHGPSLSRVSGPKPYGMM